MRVFVPLVWFSLSLTNAFLVGSFSRLEICGEDRRVDTFFYDVLDFSFLQFYKKRKLETESNQTTKKKNDQRFSYFVSFHSNSSVRQRNNYVVSFSFDHNEQFELRSRKFRENQKDNKLTFTSTASFWTTNVTREEINYFAEE